MIKGINESKTLTKHISCECKCRFDGKNWNSNQWWNNDKYRCIMDDSAIICDEIIEETVPTSFNEYETTCKTQNFYMYFC